MPHRPARACFAAAASTLLLAMGPAAQAEGNPWRLGVAQALTHDSNLLRLGDQQPLPAGASRSDTYWTTSLLAGVDETISRQRVFGDVALRDTRFRHNERFDHQGHAARLGLDWATVGRFSGSLLATHSRALAAFGGSNTSVLDERNLETVQRLSAAVRYGLIERLSAELVADRQEVDYSATAFQRRELSQDGVSLGVRYRTSAALGFGIAWREVRGRYPQFFAHADGSSSADEFRRRSLDLSADWVPSGASRFEARLSQGELRYDRATQRDFSGLTGWLSWNWRPGDKLQLITRLQRQPGQDSYLLDPDAELGTLEFSRMTTSLSSLASYKLTGKVTLRGAVGYAHRKLERSLLVTEGGPVTADDLPDLANALTATDREATAALGATWQLTRGISLGCDFRHERRSGSSLSQGSRARSIGCQGQFMLH